MLNLFVPIWMVHVGFLSPLRFGCHVWVMFLYWCAQKKNNPHCGRVTSPEVRLRGAGGLRLAEARHARPAALGRGAARRPAGHGGAADPRLSTGARREWGWGNQEIGIFIIFIDIRCTVWLQICGLIGSRSWLWVKILYIYTFLGWQGMGL